jgi:hypothetical protein
MPVILATQEAEIKRITVLSQTWANSAGDPISKYLTKKKKKQDCGVAQGVEC